MTGSQTFRQWIQPHSNLWPCYAHSGWISSELTVDLSVMANSLRAFPLLKHCSTYNSKIWPSHQLMVLPKLQYRCSNMSVILYYDAHLRSVCLSDSVTLLQLIWIWYGLFVCVWGGDLLFTQYHHSYHRTGTWKIDTCAHAHTLSTGTSQK